MVSSLKNKDMQICCLPASPPVHSTHRSSLGLGTDVPGRGPPTDLLVLPSNSADEPSAEA
jgi:hypothetical protein